MWLCFAVTTTQENLMLNTLKLTMCEFCWHIRLELVPSKRFPLAKVALGLSIIQYIDSDLKYCRRVKWEKVRSILVLTLWQVTRLQTPASRPRGNLEGWGAWMGPGRGLWFCGAAGTGAWTEAGTLTVSFATKQPQRDNDNHQKQCVKGIERRRENGGNRTKKKTMSTWTFGWRKCSA